MIPSMLLVSIILICFDHYSIIFAWKSIPLLKQSYKTKFQYETLNNILKSTATDTWWKEKNGLQFSCTGCGRCCQNDGEVWFDTDEFYDLCKLLNMTFENAIDTYTESISSGWIKMKNKIPNGVDDDQCVFLDKDGKSCSIYEARPVQCRTYPYWPSLLINSSTWDDEAVVPDSVPGKHWSRELGGCEGVNNPEAQITSPNIIRRNSEVYRRYSDQYPLSARNLPSPSDRPRLLAKLDIIKSVSRSTEAWMSDIAPLFKLPPFHLPSPPPSETEILPVSAPNYRHRVFFGTESVKILARLNYEVLVLLTEKAESLPGILLTLPFAFQDLEQFQRFEHEWRIADLAKRRLESRQQRTATSDSSSDVISGKKSPERSSLRDRIASQKSAKLEAAEILKGSQYQYYRSVAYERELTGGIEPAPYDLHFFHPQYLHESVRHSDDGDEDEDDDKDESVDFLQDESDETDPRHFIRRSPFPTVVILRNDLATMAASRNNTAVSLELLGASDFEVLQATMEKCIRMSLGWT